MTDRFETFDDRNGRRWFNRSVVSLMKERSLPGETPQEVIRRLARIAVSEAKAQGWTDIPFDVELLADIRGIEVRPATDDIRAEARLMPLPNRRLEIEYAPEAPETRRRFSICHEIAHTFFPEYQMEIQHRRNSGHFDPVHAELEQLCHIGAGELLMPLDEFVQQAGGRVASIAVAGELAGFFNASTEAALRRLVDLSEQPCCLLWLSERLKPKELKSGGPEFDFGFEGPKPKLRVDYSFASPGWRTFVPRHKSIPNNSAIYGVLKGEVCEPRPEDWSALNLGNLRLEAVTSMHDEPAAKGVMALLCQA